MGKWWVKLLIVLLVLVALVGVGLRFAAGALVRSDEFRQVAERVAERAVHPFLPQTLVQIQGIAMAGVASVAVDELTVRSAKRADVTLAVRNMVVTPDLWSLLVPGPLRFTAAATLADEGRLVLHGAIGLAALLGRDPDGEAEIFGNLEHGDAVALSKLLFDEGGATAFRLINGDLTGAFSYIKPFGSRDASGKKVGSVSAKLRRPIWELKSDATRTVVLDDISVEAELHDFELRAKTPVIFADKKGKATVRGAMLLPKHADGRLAWDLDVDIDGGTDLPTTLGHLLRCKELPAALRFQVRGPITGTSCLATPAP